MSERVGEGESNYSAYLFNGRIDPETGEPTIVYYTEGDILFNVYR